MFLGSQRMHHLSYAPSSSDIEFDHGKRKINEALAKLSYGYVAAGFSLRQHRLKTCATRTLVNNRWRKIHP
jgi:hypothetical protein